MVALEEKEGDCIIMDTAHLLPENTRLRMWHNTYTCLAMTQKA